MLLSISKGVAATCWFGTHWHMSNWLSRRHCSAGHYSGPSVNDDASYLLLLCLCGKVISHFSFITYYCIFVYLKKGQQPYLEVRTLIVLQFSIFIYFMNRFDRTIKRFVSWSQSSLEMLNSNVCLKILKYPQKFANLT